MLFRVVSKCKGTRKEQLFLAGGLGMKCLALFGEALTRLPRKNRRGNVFLIRQFTRFQRMSNVGMESLHNLKL